MSKINYDELPVEYCADCLSLAVVEEEGYSICQQCRGDKFLTAKDIFDWEILFEEKYKVNYLEWE